MSKWLRFMRASLLALLTLAPLYLYAADGGDDQPIATEEEAPIKVNAAVELPKMQKILDKIKGQVSGETNDAQLSQLNDMALELSGNADTLGQALIPQRQQLLAQLAVLGPAPKADSGVKETPEVTRKRNTLENQKAKLDEQIKQAEAIKGGALNLSAQIVNLRRDNLKTQLALNSGSIFGPRFWAPLFGAQQMDGDKLANFRDELVDTAALAWEPGWRLGTLLWLAAAVAIATLGRRYGEEFLAWISIHQLPEGRLRRSFLAAAIALTTLAAVVLAFNFIDQAFTLSLIHI